ncbi:MAG: hypothetical protein F6J94_14690 [Moorea sp. SIO1F2]|uniref:hypothetical protein n=1 Tax=unclassified Moorena TaxID=2683338 RepID=UPI0013B959D7|nr:MULTISPECIES: hypothetical protein [unclassified Moorena]NEN94568.1 hypothetical protein [Moorena sp. SIO3I7]NEO47526.1 hypothetical protein [Moorena sp. SIO4A3]NEO08701.1 hypothetical protein [Moorena sp. SIO3I8]NEO22181.1 hypothetical protein [Moorena sp. SIO4A5]NEP27322.1 hypothetical protein [Moorena sp. SIO3I6]
MSLVVCVLRLYLTDSMAGQSPPVGWEFLFPRLFRKHPLSNQTGHGQRRQQTIVLVSHMLTHTKSTHRGSQVFLGQKATLRVQQND